MQSSANQTGRKHTEDLLGGCRDFSAAYMGVKYLASHIEDHPLTITHRTIDVLSAVLASTRFDRQKQVIFLYQEAADAMISMACQGHNPVSAPIIPRLIAMLPHACGKRLRALSQSLGRLPAPFSRTCCFPDLHEAKPMELSLAFLTGNEPILVWKGRSLVVQDGKQSKLVIKFAVSKQNVPELIKEAGWMKFLTQSNRNPKIRFPKPVMIEKHVLFKITSSLPDGGPGLIDGTCIAFIPCPGYYDYPNERTGSWSEDRIKEVFFKNAGFLGKMTRMGIFHTALIPLFHNRVQQDRRNDQGAYLWEHGGRLDQWLDSCRYPNFSASGPRDFEHLLPAETSRKMGHYIGEHLLSFILVMGSYFRNKAPERRGRNRDNTPCDTRDLFSPSLFTELLEGVCRHYFSGLTQTPCPREIQFFSPALITTLIGAMGQDVHMEEVIRTRDQEQMTDERFTALLIERGITGSMVRGQRDIVLETGPHLGGFNQAISVPELIDCLFRFSAWCTAHTFLSSRPAQKRCSA